MRTFENNFPYPDIWGLLGLCEHSTTSQHVVRKGIRLCPLPDVSTCDTQCLHHIFEGPFLRLSNHGR